MSLLVNRVAKGSQQVNVLVGFAAKQVAKSLPAAQKLYYNQGRINPMNSRGVGDRRDGGAGGGVHALRSKSLPSNTIVKFVPQQEAWIVERMGKFNRILEPGLALLIPLLDRITYVQSLKEVAIEIPTQSAITQDNVTLELDGVLYYKVVDPYKASYGVLDAHFSVSQLAQTTMRAEIGQMTLDTTLAERNTLNANIVEAINTAADSWGIRCLRYEIRDIHPPDNVVEAMHSQVSAERSKRAQILDSEGQRQAAINVAEGRKQSQILASEAEKAQQINRAAGEAEAILLTAQAEARAIEKVSQAIGNSPNGANAAALQVAQQYVEAFGRLAKESNTLILPSNANDITGVVGQALGIFGKLKSGKTLDLNEKK
ncbi:Stomatin-like protein 2, mitochondrial [Zancudomyces culisetae]|uniref:Stomatin-like protein 2, mitochondrial n=1 Tax=Zancudomyces culisetae TaxID=1213189 RepID=A0A1R1PG30_ZANCU|nr:Stomatin-like protein 2, mitochondrial [Zancudomyces culisetae]|eukprot:OMH79931.1 Stomatin-like protein 2, mitochondrial [Zancudomyces culisetae]